MNHRLCIESSHPDCETPHANVLPSFLVVSNAKAQAVDGRMLHSCGITHGHRMGTSKPTSVGVDTNLQFKRLAPDTALKMKAMKLPRLCESEKIPCAPSCFLWKDISAGMGFQPMAPKEMCFKQTSTFEPL